MGSIARNAANNITTGGVFTSSAITNNSVTGITVLANASDGITLISSQTASNSASLSFTSGLTSTYKAYKFVFINIDTVSNAIFTFNMSTDGGSNYNVTKTTTYFNAYHNESGVDSALGYSSGQDLAQSTAFQELASLKSASDDNCGGTLTLFNPSSTTYVKHFICGISNNNSPYSEHYNIAGYANTTSAINAVQFKMSSGNIGAGTIYLYGIK